MLRNYVGDEGRPLATNLQEWVANQYMLLLPHGKGSERLYEKAMLKLSGSFIGDDRKGTIDEASQITVDDVKTKSFSLFWDK
jgi:hypothetical protein